jgi:paraquat-inducible protein B
VLGYTLDDNRRTVTFEIFLDAPHDQLVRGTSRFWNASGIDVSVGAGGLEVATQSLQTIIAGGIAFDTPGIEGPGGEAAQGHEFRLYESRRKVDEPVFTEKVPFLTWFSGSVRGLHAGSPVEFAGIPVGRVTDVRLEYDPARKELGVPVALEIEPQRVAVKGKRLNQPYVAVRELIAQGLRAQLKSGNLLTGELIVDLDFHPEAPPAELGTDAGSYPEIPSVPADLEAITRSVGQVLDKVAGAPIEELVVDLRRTVQGLDTLTARMGPLTASLGRAADAATAALGTAGGTLRSVDGLVGQGSPLSRDTAAMMGELSGAARSVRVLADYLERHPEALLRGKPGS